jgi:hypothetical protein
MPLRRRRKECFVSAIVSNGRIPDSNDVREPAFAATAQESPPRIVDARGDWHAAPALAFVVRGIGRMRERRRQAEIARRDSPLNLDEAWTGGWYARSRILQEALLQRESSTSAKLAPRRQDWDDKLD